MQPADILTHLVPPSTVDEELDVQQLAELLLVEGVLDAEEAERLFGVDLDGDLEWWSSRADAAAAGIAVGLRDALKAQEELENRRKEDADHKKFVETGKYPTYTPKDYAQTGQGRYEALMSDAAADLQKAVSSTVSHKYSGKHMSKSGKPVYEYGHSTTGQRLDNKPTAGSTGNPAGQVHKQGSSTTKSSLAVGQTYNVRFKGKSKKVSPKNEQQARGLARLLAAKKVAHG